MRPTTRTNATDDNKIVPVRYDPFDIGTAYAYVKNQWVKCDSQYYTIFQNCSEKELKIATEELRKQRQNHSGQSAISAKKLAEFLETAASQENIQQQRMKDLATNGALKRHVFGGSFPQKAALSIDNPSRKNSIDSPSAILQGRGFANEPNRSQPFDSVNSNSSTEIVLPSTSPTTEGLEIYDEF